MFSKDIKFLAPKKYLEWTDKSLLPVPATKTIPDWFKKLSNDVDNMTIKHCKPFLDTYTTGYILKMQSRTLKRWRLHFFEKAQM